MSAPAAPSKYTAAAATGAMAAAGTYLIVWGLKLPKPFWRPCLFSFLIEFMTHYDEAVVLTKSNLDDPKETASAAWSLPSKLGYFVNGTFRMKEKRDRQGLESGMYQAAISGVITAVVWYVAARGFFNAQHKNALWYAGAFGIIGAYGGYLQGDNPKPTKAGQMAYRTPLGGGFGAFKEPAKTN